VNYNSGPSRSIHTQNSRQSDITEGSIRAIIADEIAKAFGNFKGRSSATHNTVPSVYKAESCHTKALRRTQPTGCSYKTFMSCKPADFNGKKGAVEACEWISHTEAVLDISNCAE
jgi:hypothetical protein